MMAKGESDRTRWQKVADSHTAFGKEHPEWMGQAIEALRPWGEQTMTLQHAFAVALQAAYERGQRGDYPQPIDYFDRYKDSEDDVETDSGRRSRIVRRSRSTSTDVEMVDAENTDGHAIGGRPQRMRRTSSGGVVHQLDVPIRITRSRPAPTHTASQTTILRRSRS